MSKFATSNSVFEDPYLISFIYSFDSHEVFIERYVTVRPATEGVDNTLSITPVITPDPDKLAIMVDIQPISDQLEYVFTNTAGSKRLLTTDT